MPGGVFEVPGLPSAPHQQALHKNKVKNVLILRPTSFQASIQHSSESISLILALMMVPSESQHHLLITAPRTASTMFVKMLNLDEQDVRPSNYGGYNFLPSMEKRYTLQPRPMSQWTYEELMKVHSIMQTCFDNMQDYIEKSHQEQKLVFVKEHGMLINHPWFESEFLHGKRTTVGEPTPLMPRGDKKATRSEHNKTILSDEFLKTWRPTFLIRHPAMVFPSLFRLFRNEASVDRPASQI